MARNPTSKPETTHDEPPEPTWVDGHAPAWLRPYLKLARFDRPIGSWLLLFPCWWSLGLANLSVGRVLPELGPLIAFFIGAFVMRGAGCTWNDIVDRDYDAQVQRTASRPLPAGEVSVVNAVLFAVGLSFIGLLVLLTFNTFTIALAIASLVLVAIYPFMKRYTHWPQLVLGLGFNWGALVGWSAAMGSLASAPLVLYAGSVAWTLGYDTIYAHQDRDDDTKAGLKSTAILFGPATPVWVTGFYSLALAAWGLAGWLAGAGVVFFAGLLLAALHFAWQIKTLDIDDGANCMARFKSNRTIGVIVFVAIVADMLARGALSY